MKIFIAVFVSLFLAACGTAKVITATEQAIAIDIKNTGMTSSEMIEGGAAIAREHCAKFGKKASFERTAGFLGAAHTAYFSCK